MKYIVSLILGTLIITSAFAQTGSWKGNLNVQGVELPLVFHLDDENPTVDSPAQGAKGIPMQLERSGETISVKIPMVGASFQGTLNGDKIEGTFTQNGYSFPLTLTRGEEALNRPQTPAPPFPYSQEEVSFANGDALLKGTLVLPEDYTENTPVLLMVSGSGLQNRDEELLGHKPFAVIADALGREGIATLRYDDRGFGESSGDATNCTTEDFKKDAAAGIEFLKKRFDKVGVLGHSEGGTIALMLGAENKADFVVSLAAMTVSGAETLIDQNKILLTSENVPDSIVQEYCVLLADTFKAIKNKEGLPDAERYNLPQPLVDNYKKVVDQLELPYLKYFVTLDIRNQLEKIKIPVLALNGTKDIQVNYQTNLEALRTSLPNNPKNQIKSIEGVNHLFQHCQTGLPNEYGVIEETISPEVLKIMTEWIKKL